MKAKLGGGVPKANVEALAVLPGVYGLLLGYDDGSFIHLESMAAVPDAFRASERGPEGAAYRLTEIRRSRFLSGAHSDAVGGDQTTTCRGA